MGAGGTALSRCVLTLDDAVMGSSGMLKSLVSAQSTCSDTPGLHLVTWM